MKITKKNRKLQQKYFDLGYQNSNYLFGYPIYDYDWVDKKYFWQRFFLRKKHLNQYRDFYKMGQIKAFEDGIANCPSYYPVFQIGDVVGYTNGEIIQKPYDDYNFNHFGRITEVLGCGKYRVTFGNSEFNNTGTYYGSVLINWRF